MLEIKNYPAAQGWLWMKEAKTLLRHNIWFWESFTVGYLGLLILWNVILYYGPAVVQYTTMIPSQLVQSLLGIGIAHIVIESRQGNKPTLRTLTSPFKKRNVILRSLNILLFCYLMPVLAIALIFAMNFALNFPASDYLTVFELIKSKQFYLIPTGTLQILIVDITVLSVLILLFLAFISFATNLIGLYDCTTSEALKLSLKANFKNIGAFGVLFGFVILSIPLMILTFGLGVLLWIPFFLILNGLIMADVFQRTGRLSEI